MGHYESFREGKITDPYLSAKGMKEPNICPTCLAIYHKKRWAFDPKMLATLKKSKEFSSHKCPACRKIEDKFVMGIVNISGTFAAEHADEILRLVKAEEKRALEKNPLERLISISNKKGLICLETTSDTLALRIGKALKRTYKGKHEYDFRYGDKHVEVDWSRDLAG